MRQEDKERLEGLLLSFRLRFPEWQPSEDDMEYLTQVAMKTEIRTEHFGEWLFDHAGTEDALREGGAFLVVECYDDHHLIWPRKKDL